MTNNATTTTEKVINNNRPWVERYRPKDLKQVSHQNEVVATLQNAVETGRLPHLLFYGPPGSGKTSVALALCRQLWHPTQWKRRVLELNASDERGISVVRDKIKHFASLAVGTSTNTTNNKKQKSFFTTNNNETKENDDNDESKYPNPPFKIIILDEADTVTPDAQAALRRIIEAHSRITRFILICNYVTRIIEPLASRCAKFRFQSLPPNSMKTRLMEIATAENCSENEIALIDDILNNADGDMRRAVTTLQSVHSLMGNNGTNNNNGDDIGTTLIAEINGLPPPSFVDELYKAMTSTTFDIMQKGVDEVTAEGYSGQLLLEALLKKVITSKLSELSKADIAIRIAEAEKNMIEGADEYLQLLNVGSMILKCHQKDNSSSGSSN